jgi:hypothetical protein
MCWYKIFCYNPRFMTFKAIENAIRKLSAKERSKLAATLLSSLDGDERTEQLWIKEADRRYRAYRAGRTASVPAKKALAAAKASLHR